MIQVTEQKMTDWVLKASHLQKSQYISKRKLLSYTVFTGNKTLVSTDLYCDIFKFNVKPLY